MDGLTKVFLKGEEADPKKMDTVSNLIFVDGGAREGELYPIDHETPGTYFKISENGEYLEVRHDLGEHVDYAFMPWNFKVLQDTFQNSEFHLFEPNPDFIETLHNKAKYISNFGLIVWVHQMAIGTEVKKSKFNLTQGGWGSSLIEEKKEDFIDNIEVQEIDFLTFLRSFHQRPSNNQRLHIKLDIEGGEYTVLDHLFRAGLPPLVKSLSVEFHKDFMESIHNEWWLKYAYTCINLGRNNITFNWWPGEW